MYDYNAVQAKVLKNSTKKENPKTKFFNENMKMLMETQGMSRQQARNAVRVSTWKPGNIGASQFSKNNLRKTRKERSKRLMVPFTPTYNGAVYMSKWVKDKNGKFNQEFYKVSGE